MFYSRIPIRAVRGRRQLSGKGYYDLGMISARLSLAQDDRAIENRQREFRERPKSMVFDPLRGVQPPNFEQVFNSTNKSTKSSRRDVSYREVYRLIGGVKVPKRPVEPDSCCMSGCVNCVWDLFAEDLEYWKGKQNEAVVALEKQGDTVAELWPLGFDPPPKGLPEKYIPEELRQKKPEKAKNEMPVGLQVLQAFERKKKKAKEAAQAARDAERKKRAEEVESVSRLSSAPITPITTHIS